MTFGGRSWVSPHASNEAFFVTLRHDQRVAYVARVPNASLPVQESFRGNMNLRLGDDRHAFIGSQTVMGINKLDKVD